MPEFHFRVDGLTEENVRRWRRRTRPTAISATVLLWTTAVAVGIYSVRASTPTALVQVLTPTTKNVLVMVDASGSMKGTEEILKKQLAQVEALGVLVERHTTRGFGVSMTGDRRTPLLERLEATLQANPNVDAIYVVSDFSKKTPRWDESNEAGYQRLRQILQERRLRMYLGTVRDDPPRELAEIARQSGGDVIESK